MLVSKVLRRSALPISALRPVAAIPKARALHVASGSKLRPTVTPLNKTRFTPSLTAIRFNSTSSSTPAAAAAATSSAPSEPVTDPNILNDIIDPVAPALTALSPDQMGYLKSLGIDFGWGISSCIQTLLEAVHVYGHLPWWATVLATVLAVRAAQFPLYLKQSDTNAKMKEIGPALTPITNQMKLAQQKGDMQGMLTARSEIQRYLKVSGIQRKWLFLPLTQIPVYYGFFRNFREMSDVPVPALVNDGILWFQDLSVQDPYFILPALSSAFIAMNLKAASQQNNNFAVSVQTALMIALPTFSFVITCQWPALITFYFMLSSMVAYGQTKMFNNPKFRKMFGLYPLPEVAINPLAPTTPNTIDGTINNASEPSTQIGAKGSFLDKLTGGKGGWQDKLTGKLDSNDAAMSVKGLFEKNAAKQKEREHKLYEERRKAKIAEQQKAEELARERRRRMKQN
ncbi:Similar to Mitochondrial inner membrane protein OXA1; acc. no. O13375 [Pyronema omphalodes CBS 100304]|uniref:Similar to Mitochondrial inner membrane protein OXA1 acc. no. O13375 n=1 Tax=Pyronema omphalodes (strain CBS 100304) TaxID=1076935 RepID=U4LVM7_PYROM|nr:Similar to Mitochondrial inner membrane protein OXA1; acc. no. O13375 [Pyronema omphalodes CBS 100304]